jgi:transposase
METKIETIGGLPLITSLLKELNIRNLINEQYQLHGNWSGSDKGLIVSIWIVYILSRCDHRLSVMEDWVSDHELILGREFGHQIDIKDFTDDRLGKLLDEFSVSERWDPFERSVNQQMLQVYEIQGGKIQLDATIGQSFGQVVEDGLLQSGYSKQFRRDLPQFKTMLANLGNENIPLGSLTVSGDKSDDELYIPIIKLAKQNFAKNGLLWQGDKKMSSIATRHHIVCGEDYYLSPLSEVQVSKSRLCADYLVDFFLGEQVLIGVPSPKTTDLGEPVVEIAFGFEKSVQVEHLGRVWTERRLVVRSCAYAIGQEKLVRSKLEKAIAAIEHLNQRIQGKKVLRNEAELKACYQGILKKYEVEGFLNVDYQAVTSAKEIPATAKKEARTDVKFSYAIQCAIDEPALQAQLLTLGWRIYATNMPSEGMTLTQAVHFYREEYKIEHRFHNLKTEVTRLLPVFLKKDTRIVGLIHLLMLVLKLIGVLEYKIQKKLAQNNEVLQGLYAGNPKMATKAPTISKIMSAMASISIAYVFKDGILIQALLNQIKPIQGTIMHLFDIDLKKFSSNKNPIENSSISP